MAFAAERRPGDFKADLGAGGLVGFKRGMPVEGEGPQVHPGFGAIEELADGEGTIISRPRRMGANGAVDVSIDSSGFDGGGWVMRSTVSRRDGRS